MTKNVNTKPKQLLLANPRPPRRSNLNATSIVALERKKKAWDEVLMTNRKTGKTTRNSPRPLHAAPTKQILVPNTLSTSNIRKRKTSINQMGQRTNFAHRMAVDDGRPSKGRKWTALSDFFDGHPKPQFRIHYPHWLIHWMPNESSEIIKRKDGETMTKIEKRKRTTLTFGSPLPSEGSALVSLPRFSQNQHKNDWYMRHFNTVLMKVLT